MGRIIFDLVLILANIWIIFDKDSPTSLKRFALLGVILLTLSVTAQVCIIM